MYLPLKSNIPWIGKRRWLTCYFVHIPKCGGSFVERVLSPYILDCPILTLDDARGHLTWLEYKRIFLLHGLDIMNGETFSVVRNPWDWHVSWFHYIKQDLGGKKSGHHVEHELFQNFSFIDYIHWLDDSSTQRGAQGYIIKQMSDWLIDKSERLVVDNVFRQENLKNDLLAFVMQKHLAVKINTATVNSSKRKCYQNYFNTECRQIVARRHSRDIALFGYVY